MASYPYWKGDKEEPAKISNLFIDTGCETKEEVDKMERSWDAWSLISEFMILNENKLFVAIDNRMGGFFMIAEVARLLHGKQSEITVQLY
jgi:putative aminopeptidase FrvX